MSTRPPGTSSEPQPVTIRPVRPSDHVELARFYAALSADSRYARFLSTRPGISDVAAASFCGPDHEHREGLVALAPDDGRARLIVGHLCLDPLDDGAFEMAVAVADGWRSRGIGRRLLVESMAWARRHGVARLRATMLTTNSPIIALIRSTAQGVRLSSPEAGVIEAVIEIGSEVPAATLTTPRPGRSNVMERILLAYDGGEPARKALALTADMAKAFNATVIVVSVVPIHPGRTPIDPWDDGEVHHAELRDAANTLRELGIEPELVFASGDPARTIERIAVERSVDTIIVGARGLGVVGRALQGSVSEHVATHAPATVIVAR